jgi:DNA primase
MPGLDYREIRSLLSMSQVLDLLDFAAQKRSGHELRGPCPDHGSDSPLSRSFSANLSKNVYRCFRCGSAGNHLDLYAAATRQALFAAAIDLCNRLGYPIPWITEK